MNIINSIKTCGSSTFHCIRLHRGEDLLLSIKTLAEKETNVIFGGRLGEYKYYDMDAVIEKALSVCKAELGL